MENAKLVATIVIPTHNHGPTLRTSVASVLRQTVPDIEVFVVGDGMTEETRDIASEIAETDQRVIVFDNPKGQRHGEIYRHAALQSARGRIVCYLSDDDLYFPNHVEHMSELLEEADFAHALASRVEPNGESSPFIVDFSISIYRTELLAGRNRIPLSSGAHTLSAYRALAQGWTCAPAAVPTDVFMWSKFIHHPGCRFRGGWRPTVLVFPAQERKTWPLEERVRELEAWLGRISERCSAGNLTTAIYKQVVRASAELEAWAVWERQVPKGSLHLEVLQVFFPGDDGYTEEASARFNLNAGTWRTIEVIVACRKPHSSIRIDPAAGPCLIQISDISVRRLDGGIAWQLSRSNVESVRVLGAIAHDYREGTLNIVNEGDDPQVLLPSFDTEAPEEQVRLSVTVKFEARDGDLFDACRRLSGAH